MNSLEIEQKAIVSYLESMNLRPDIFLKMTAVGYYDIMASIRGYDLIYEELNRDIENIGQILKEMFTARIRSIVYINDIVVNGITNHEPLKKIEFDLLLIKIGLLNKTNTENLFYYFNHYLTHIQDALSAIEIRIENKKLLLGLSSNLIDILRYYFRAISDNDNEAQNLYLKQIQEKIK